MAANVVTSATGGSYPYGLFGDGTSCIAEFGNQGFRGDDLYWPWYCDVSNTGTMVIADTDNNRIQVYEPNSNTSAFPPYGGMGHLPGQLKSPKGVAFSAIPGTSIAIADTGNRRISMVAINFMLGKLEHAYSFGETILVQPTDVAVDRRNGNIVVSDESLNKVFVFSQHGQQVGELEQRGFKFNRPSAVIITHDGKSDIYVSDSGNHCVRRFTCNGDYIGTLGELGQAEGQFNTPRGLSLDRKGYLYVADEKNNRVQMFTPDLLHVTTVVTGVALPKGVAIGTDLLVTTGDQKNFAKLFRSTC